MKPNKLKIDLPAINYQGEPNTTVYVRETGHTHDACSAYDALQIRLAYGDISFDAREAFFRDPIITNTFALYFRKGNNVHMAISELDEDAVTLMHKLRDEANTVRTAAGSKYLTWDIFGLNRDTTAFIEGYNHAQQHNRVFDLGYMSTDTTVTKDDPKVNLEDKLDIPYISEDPLIKAVFGDRVEQYDRMHGLDKGIEILNPQCYRFHLLKEKRALVRRLVLEESGKINLHAPMDRQAQSFRVKKTNYKTHKPSESSIFSLVNASRSA